MLACGKVGASALEKLAWADKATVFGDTDPVRERPWKGNVAQVMVAHVVESSFFLKSN